MMAHPKLVKKWAFFLKPEPTESQVLQAQIMREARRKKREFLESQGNLFASEIKIK